MRSIVRRMLWLFRIWLFVRFVNEQDVKLHELIRTPEMKKFRGSVKKGYVHKDKTIAAYASKRFHLAYLKKISEGRVASLCEAAIGMGFIIESQDNHDHKRSIIVTKQGHEFSETFFGLVEVMYKRYPKATAIIFSAGTIGVVIGAFHLLEKLWKSIL